MRARRLTLRGVAFASATLLAALALGGSAAAQDGSEDDEGKSTDWRVSFDSEIDFKANIFRALNTPPYFIFTEVYEPLLNSTLETAEPDLEHSLATSYEVSDDGLVYTFHLRSGLKWADGEPLTAEDAAWSWENAVNSYVNSGYATYLEKAEALDDVTVRLTFSQPDARVPQAYIPIVPKHIWGELPVEELTTHNQCCPMIGSGPFMVTKLDASGTTILERNPHFREPAGPIERILMTKYEDKEAQLRDIKLNFLDAILEPDSNWVRSVDDPDLTVWSAPYPGFNELAFNSCPAEGTPTCTGPGPEVAVEVVQDRAIRHALNWAIDKDNLARIAWGGAASAAHGIISPFYEPKGYYKDWSTDPNLGFTYDPDRARQVLADGGWACPAGGICTKDGVTAEFRLLVRSTEREDQNAARRIQAWARDVGIQINLSLVTTDAINAEIYNETSSSAEEDADKYEPTYDAFMWGWFADLGFPDYDFEILTCGSFSTDSFYCNPEFDELQQAAIAETDFEKRVDLLHEAEGKVLEDSPYVFLIHGEETYVTRNDTWTNYQPQPGAGASNGEGNPYSISWLQLELIEAGEKPSTNYAGAPAAMALLIAGVVAAFAISRLRRRREESGPLERPEPTPSPGGAGR